jgi:hypothetical protein
VPSAHRLMRFKFGRTIHAELIPSSTACGSAETRQACGDDVACETTS